jgi:hypothetical protein
MTASIQIETDLVPIRSALYETGELVRQLVAPPQTLDIIRERLFGSPDVLDEFVTIRTEINGTVGAQRMYIFYEPSNVLLRLMSALRAGQYEFLTLKCHGLPVPLLETAIPAIS